MKNAQKKIAVKKTKKGKTPIVSKKSPVTRTRRLKSPALPKADSTVSKHQGIKELLLEQKRALLQKARSELSELVGGGNKFSGLSDEGDLAATIYEDSVAAAKATRFNNQVKTISAALEKFDNGTYGICEECGEKIPQGRLEKLPFALRCVQCQEDKENRTPHDREEVPGSS